jgi:hypothetical protein
MAVDSFSKRPLSPNEWPARARVIQEQLQGLSIAELMRGGKQGDLSDHDGRAYDSNQPRVPAGNSDGGQWTSRPGGGGAARINDPRVLSDATPDNHWIVGADYAAVGHHYDPKALWRNLPLRSDTREVLDRAVSGPLGATLHNPITGETFRHQWDKEHQQYNQAVGELFKMYVEGLHSNGITIEKMTPDHAREFLRSIFRSQDPRIRVYLDKIRLLRRLLRRRGQD